MEEVSSEKPGLDDVFEAPVAATEILLNMKP